MEIVSEPFQSRGSSLNGAQCFIDLAAQAMSVWSLVVHISGQVAAARAALKEMPEALNVADLDQKRRDAWEKDVQKKMESVAKLQDFKPISKKHHKH